MKNKFCIVCNEPIKENNYNCFPEEVNYKVFSINGIFGDSYMCSKCLNELKKNE